MNYEKHYWALIDRARHRPLPKGYTERHHILPRCMGGGHDDGNVVRLKPEEHFIAHLLLTRMHPDNVKLAYARRSMTRMAGLLPGSSQNKRYAFRAVRAWETAGDNWKRLWAKRFPHRPRGKRLYSKADVAKLAAILAPGQIFS
jgi:hypothetical protein